MRMRYAKKILYASPIKVTGTLGSVTDAWTGEKKEAYASITPPRGEMQIAAYGQYLPDMSTLYLDVGNTIKAGDGVWLNGNAKESPSAKVLAVREYPMHIEADIRNQVGA